MSDIVERLRADSSSLSIAIAAREGADEIERLRAAVEDAVETLEAMDLHIDNPLYERLRAAVEQKAE